MSATPIVMDYHSVLGTNVATMYEVSTQLIAVTLVLRPAVEQSVFR
jgi:hypothetical protein